MPRKRNNPVSLSREDRGKLEGLIAGGHASARQLTHARILLKADEGEDAPNEASSWPDTKIADALKISRSTVARVRQRFAWEGLEAALVHRRPKATKPPKLWPARSLPRAKSAGACVFWPSVSFSWSAPKSPSPESWSGALSKKCHKALAQGAVVHPAKARWLLRLAYGGYP
jgi:hypothetical protein